MLQRGTPDPEGRGGQDREVLKGGEGETGHRRNGVSGRGLMQGGNSEQTFPERLGSWASVTLAHSPQQPTPPLRGRP